MERTALLVRGLDRQLVRECKARAALSDLTLKQFVTRALGQACELQALSMSTSKHSETDTQ